MSFFSNAVNTVETGILSAETTLSVYSTLILSILFSIVIVFIATRKFNLMTGAIISVIALLTYIISSSARGQNLESSLPSVTYPIPPHLGLDGNSLVNTYPSPIGYGL